MAEAREKEEETTSSNTNNNINNGNLDEEEAWGTLEELLLVCAVNRYGTHKWDSIAKELQKRIKHSSNNDENEDNDEQNERLLESSYFSSRNCRRKYVHLKRRFCYDVVDGNDNINGNGNGEGESDGEGERHVLFMVDELRKLRVEELKRQVHHHDASIVSLQLKVKRLEEERERSKVKGEEQEDDDEDTVLSDLRKKPEENVRIAGEKPDEPFEKIITGDSAENRSCNESNSTNHNNNNNKTAVVEERESKLKCEEEPDPVGPENKKRKSEPVGVVSRLVELGESMSESRKESTKQQSSDVQSSASLSKKKRRRLRGVGDNSGDELEAEELSPANKRINAKSQPLIRFFDTLRSHKHGSVFNRRLPSQETEKFRNAIRQYLDLDTVQSRLDKGIYCDCHPKFYRDLLLIFTNAVLFYRKSSAEHIAAKELRKLVIDEINQKTRKPKIQPRKPDLEPQQLEPVVKKPRSTTMVVCRRRSSSSMQALSDSMKKGDAKNMSTTNSKNNVENEGDEKIKLDLLQKKISGSRNNSNGSLSSKEKKSNKDGASGADTSLKKLLAKERSSLGNGGLRLNNSNGKKIISKGGNKKDKIESVCKDVKDESFEGDKAEVGESKKITITNPKQEKSTPTILKKQGVANFLERMKQNSPSSQEKTKNNDSEGEKDEEEEAKKIKRDKTQNIINGNVKKARKSTKEVEVSTRSSSRRGEKAAATAASRRGIGRPPKRKASMMSGGTPDSTKGGRSGGREGGEKVKKKARR